jgi:hypothetical protein
MAKKVATTETATPAKHKLTKTQVRVLETLKRVGKPMLRSALKEKTNVDFSTVVGCQDDAMRTENEAKRGDGYKSLITLKFVKWEEIGVNGAKDDKKETVYSITPAGIKALEAAKK